MFDAISPARATRPAEACRLIADAVSGGDLDAALGHYEPDAVIELADGTTVRGHDEIRPMLGRAAESKLLYDVEVEKLLTSPGLALVLGRWSSRGTDASGRRIEASGTHRSVVRHGDDGFWRVVIETISA